MSGARHFAANNFDVKCQHSSEGPPLKTFIFTPPADSGTMVIEYAKHVQIAVQSVLKQFPRMSLDGRLAIIGPDQGFVDAHRGAFAKVLHSDLPNLEFVDAEEASCYLPFALFKSPRTREQTSVRVIFDEISAMDGLERLIVIGVGLDGAEERSRIRSQLYRAVSRAQLMFAIVNHAVPGGCLEWTGCIQFDNDAKFSEEKERKRVNPLAASTLKLAPSLHSEPTKSSAAESQKPDLPQMKEHQKEISVQEASVMHSKQLAHVHGASEHPSLSPNPLVEAEFGGIDESIILKAPLAMKNTVWETSGNTHQLIATKPPAFMPLFTSAQVFCSPFF